RTVSEAQSTKASLSPAFFDLSDRASCVSSAARDQATRVGIRSSDRAWKLRPVGNTAGVLKGSLPCPGATKRPFSALRKLWRSAAGEASRFGLHPLSDVPALPAM